MTDTFCKKKNCRVYLKLPLKVPLTNPLAKVFNIQYITPTTLGMASYVDVLTKL